MQCPNEVIFQISASSVSSIKIKTLKYFFRFNYVGINQISKGGFCTKKSDVVPLFEVASRVPEGYIQSLLCKTLLGLIMQSSLWGVGGGGGSLRDESKEHLRRRRLHSM